MVLVFDGLYNCIQVFTHYFEVLEEESLRDNFVVVVSKDKSVSCAWKWWHKWKFLLETRLLFSSFFLMMSYAFWQYELLDEIMDFGFPQYTEARILSEFIKTDAFRMEVAQRPPMAVTNAVSWRSEGIRYKKNEVGWLLARVTHFEFN